jgi:hypothetical protein
MTRILLLAAIAGSLVAPPVAADAATGKKHRHYHRQGPAAVVYRQSGNWQAPVRLRPHGPPWAMPNECFNDEGYGRWSPCGGRDY